MGGKRELDSCGQCLKYIMFAMNFIFFCVGGAIAGVGIWILVDRNFMSQILGTALMTAAAWIIIIAGGVILLISFFGCMGAIMENKCALMVYFIFVILAFLVLIVAGILAIVFRSQLGEEVKTTMRNSVQKYYGVEMDDGYNRAVTEAWDEAQKRLYCCAVEDSSWNAYRGSEWYKMQPGVPEVSKPLVPESCCVVDQYGNYLQKQKCQTWNQGPPRQTSGERNEALHYRGCFTAGRDWVMEYSAYLIGMGIGIGLIMLFGAFISVWLYRNISD